MQNSVEKTSATPMIVGGLVFSILWLSILTLWAFRAIPDEEACQVSAEITKFRALHCLSLNEFGDFLAGGFSVLAFFWLALAVLLQRQELVAQRLELRQTRLALEAQAEESKRSANYLDEQARVLRDQYNLTSEKRSQEESERLANLAIENVKYHLALLLYKSRLAIANDEEKQITILPAVLNSDHGSSYMVDAMVGGSDPKKLLEALTFNLSRYPRGSIALVQASGFSPFDLRDGVEQLYEILRATRQSFFVEFENTHGVEYLKEAARILTELSYYDEEYYTREGYRIVTDGKDIE